MIFQFFVQAVAFLLILPCSTHADEQYFYTYTTGKDIRFSSITVTGVQAAGLRPGPTKTFASTIYGIDIAELAL